MTAPAENPWLRREIVAPWWEIACVVAATIGYSIVRSGWSAYHGSSTHFIGALLTDRNMGRYIAIEAGLLALLLGYLHWRGWKTKDLRIRESWRSTGLGFLLWPLTAVTNSIVVVLAALAAYAMQTEYHSLKPFISSLGQHLPPHSVNLDLTLAFGAMFLNALYEEITCLGYAFSQFAAHRGPLFALVLTVLLRMACHSYQGPIHMLGIGAVFTVTGLVYWKTRNLWPVIVAHALVDSGSLLIIAIARG